MEVFSPLDLLQSVISLEHLNLESKGIQISLAMNQIKSFGCLRGDKHRIAQVLLNLLQNAIKFSIIQSTIDVSCWFEPEKQLINFSVVDHGPGISRDDMHLLFT
jgi:signal transduction histidine kinase